MSQNNYNIEHIIEALESRGFTNFISQKELRDIKGKIRKNEYIIYETHNESNKVILYKKNPPQIDLLKISNVDTLRHQDILGTIYSLGIKDDTFGDIVKYEDSFYIFTIPSISSYIIYNLDKIKNNYVEITIEDIEISKNFIQDYIKKEIIVSSLRLDNILSSLINKSRNDISDIFKNKEVILNYDDNIKPTRVLKEGDVFSVRRYGKFKYNRVLKNTKKGGFIIEILIYK